MHERAAAALGLRCHYQLIEVVGATPEELKLLLEGVRRLGFAGINVTFPYKEAVTGLLDELSPSARMIGAVNTVVVRNGRLVGYNTDTTGFSRAVGRLIAASAHGAVTVIGAGGVGKAIAFALASLGVSELRIFDRELAKATHLATQLQGQTSTSVPENIEDAVQGVAGIVNGSPVGMLPDCHTPVPEGCLHAGMWVADAVYFPLWTPLLLAAKASGASIMTGRELAIYQAADAFELFTGLRPSSIEMATAFDDVIARRCSPSHPL